MISAPPPSFAVSYVGSGSWATRYHSTPPNPGGAADRNDAHDTSAQAWRLRFAQPLRLVSGTLGAASGSERIAVVIDHVHLDGLYAFDDASARCQLRGSAGPRLGPAPTIVVRRSRDRLVLSIGSPLTAGLLALPAGCAGAVDGIDGLLDDYATPGFSFDSVFTPQRWLTGRVSLALATLRSARRVRIRVSSSHAGTPPANCRVPEPSYERCTTGGRWSGVLTLTRRS
jgi:hypothetical protein